MSLFTHNTVDNYSPFASHVKKCFIFELVAL
jgi:hypothetical protein